MERKMIRFKQSLPDVESQRILTLGKYAVWAVDGDDDYPYAVPVNYVYDGDAIYIHCSRQGHKIDSIARNPRCSLCIVEKADVVPEEFTSYFRSVIVFGRAEIVEDDMQRLEAIQLLCAKYSSVIDPADEIARFRNTVCMVRINIDSITGKEAIELTRQRNNPSFRDW